ncbi:MAG: ABC transporter substrate-binding protein [Thermomicrobiales bacterium]|jgi:ABC-type branched-subunit amino acid transport system substrate-binding protein|nr:ABC transporter substrate-binding protein [Thermomicrobiales bacterium]
MRSRLILVAFALMLTIPMAISRGAGVTTAQDEIAPLKIGALLPFTGDLSDFGQPMFNAMQLAVDEINAAGGVNGQPVELVQGDDGTAPQQAVEEARRLVEVEGVSAIVGPAASGVAQQVIETVTGPGHILHFSHSATSNALTPVEDNDFFFRTTIADSAQGKVMAEVAQGLGYTSACTMYINGPYGQGLSAVFTESFEALGGTVTAQVPHESAQGSFVSELTACTEGNPDVLVAISYPESMSVYLREAVEQGLVENFLFSDGGRSPDMFAELGWSAFEGMQGTSAGAPDTAAGDAFDVAFEAAFGTQPSVPYLREGYDAIYLIALAAEVADSVDPTAMRDVLRDVANPPGEVVGPGSDGWTAALELIAAGTDIDYEGAAGSQNLDENGDVLTGTINIWAIQGEEVVIIESRDVDLSQ